MYRTLNSHAYAAYIVGHETRAQIMDGALEHQKLYDAILSNKKVSSTLQLPCPSILRG